MARLLFLLLLPLAGALPTDSNHLVFGTATALHVADLQGSVPAQFSATPAVGGIAADGNAVIATRADTVVSISIADPAAAAGILGTTASSPLAVAASDASLHTYVALTGSLVRLHPTLAAATTPVPNPPAGLAVDDATGDVYVALLLLLLCLRGATPP